MSSRLFVRLLMSIAEDALLELMPAPRETPSPLWPAFAIVLYSWQLSLIDNASVWPLNFRRLGNSGSTDFAIRRSTWLLKPPRGGWPVLPFDEGGFAKCWSCFGTVGCSSSVLGKRMLLQWEIFVLVDKFVLLVFHEWISSFQVVCIGNSKCLYWTVWFLSFHVKVFTCSLEFSLVV